MIFRLPYPCPGPELWPPEPFDDDLDDLDEPIRLGPPAAPGRSGGRGGSGSGLKQTPVKALKVGEGSVKRPSSYRSGVLARCGLKSCFSRLPYRGGRGKVSWK